MSDLIDRQKLISKINDFAYAIGLGGMETVVVGIIKGQPTVEPERTAERINTAREMIEAEITGAEKGGWRELNYLDGLRFAIECLDKPAEPTVSVAEVRKAFELARYYDRTELFDKWLKEKEATHE